MRSGGLASSAYSLTRSEPQWEAVVPGGGLHARRKESTGWAGRDGTGWALVGLASVLGLLAL
jgi:hypothetical protein